MSLPTDPIQFAALVLFVLIAALGMAGYFLRYKLGARGMLACCMLAMMLAVIGALLTLAPSGKLAGWVGAGLMLGNYWLLSRFENTEKK